ncbi:guanine nucleotide-binding protein G(I)/G(S)/G(O) subunit gamma-T2 [Egretta garzetta]|uniref:guanine nucleotide-binding protein G(I)/G(S)/G(O) subunit gamma-T2 n=1 Tax=Egretta garzetta TaxID=188379 RepID=UPI00163D0DC4|nr:guanine nucleotide-binding protein G(I)/G(S)/G(O) subunit gamma-T2 [Egretta garzetta]
MAQDMTEKELLKMELDQLKKEVKNERQMVSFSPQMPRGRLPGQLRDLITLQRQKTHHDPSMAGEDPLLKGVPEDKNPFKEKGGCTIS